MKKLVFGAMEMDKKTKRIIGIGSFLTFLILFATYVIPNHFKLNVTESVPKGIYSLEAVGQVEKGSIYVFDYKACCKVDVPNTPNLPLFIKRVAGLPGDKLFYNDSGELVLQAKDGRETAYYVQPHTQQGDALPKIDPQTIPANHYFMVGDIKQSFDSRYYGVVNKAFFEHKAEHLYQF